MTESFYSAGGPADEDAALICQFLQRGSNPLAKLETSTRGDAGAERSSIDKFPEHPETSVAEREVKVRHQGNAKQVHRGMSEETEKTPPRTPS